MKTRFLLLTFILITVVLSCKKDIKIPLEAAFEADVENTVAGGSIVFADRSSGNPSKWKWTFEGGSPSTSNLSGPAVTYELPGTYAVTLEVTNVDGSSVLKKESYINVSYNDVAAAFEVDKTTAMQGESLAFKDLSTGLPNTWLWEFIPETGSAIKSTEQNPVITFKEFGIYTVKLTASNPLHSDQVTKAKYINILDATSVEAAFTSNETATYTGGSINFSDQSIGNAASWSWTFDGGTPSVSTDKNPTVTYNTPGRYKVKLVTSNPSKSSVMEKEGYIIVVPGADLSVFFPFNGHSSDVGPSKIASDITGAVVFTGTDRRAVINSTAVFPGSSYIMVPDHDAFNFETGNYTISCWIKTDKTNRMMVWQESGGKGSGDNQTWLRLNDNLTTPQLLRLAVEDAGGGTSLTIGAPGRVSDNNWYHVVAVREGTNLKVYVNGVKMSTEGNAPALRDVSNEGGFKIGAQQGPTAFSNYFSGQIDDLIIYKKALSAAEVLALYNL